MGSNQPARRSSTTLYGFSLRDLLDTDDPRAFSPRTTVYSLVARTLAEYEMPVPSNQEVYAFLRKEEGIKEVTRRGVRGFLGITTIPELHESKRLVPAGTASARKHRGDQSDQAKQAVIARRLRDTKHMRAGTVAKLLNEYPHKFF